MNEIIRETEEASATPLVRTASAICAEDVAEIVKGYILAVRIPEFYPRELCDRFIGGILAHDKIEHYAVAPDIKKIGKAIFDAASDSSALDEYYATSANALREMREYFHPYLAPMDKLRLTLQEVWPSGSLIENLHGKLMFCGLVRAFGKGSEARPHQDMTHWDIPDCQAAQTLTTQIACNIYMATVDSGGELELWAHGIGDAKAYTETQTPGDYGLDRHKIGPPVARISPRKGDLIMFDARRIHAVTRIEEGVRVAVSSFIGYRGPTAPLSVYS